MSDNARTTAPDPVEAMLAQASLKTTLFCAEQPLLRHRYDGHHARRHHDSLFAAAFVPGAGRFQVLQEHTVKQGERLDNITAQYFGDPTLFWRVCDANNAMRPAELTETLGLRLRITMPDGISGGAL